MTDDVWAPGALAGGMRISVICPVYNTDPQHLAAAAGSVLSQLGAELELLLVDDRSSAAGTLAMLERLRQDDARVRVVHLPENLGPARARAAGIEVASGNWIGFIDSDDIWEDGTVACVARVATGHPQASWLGSNYRLWHSDGLVPAPSIAQACPGEALGDGVIRLASPELTRVLIGNHWLHLGTCFVRTELLRRLAPFPAGLIYNEDWLFFLRLSVAMPLHLIPWSGYRLRRQHESLTTDPRRLTMLRAHSHQLALTDPMLRPFRREIRWALYSTLKGIAANNLLAGRRWHATWFAARAFVLAPTSFGDAWRFLQLLLRSDLQRLRAELPSYSRVELYRSVADRRAAQP